MMRSAILVACLVHAAAQVGILPPVQFCVSDSCAVGIRTYGSACPLQQGPVLMLNTCDPKSAVFQKWTNTANGTRLYLGGGSGQPSKFC